MNEPRRIRKHSDYNVGGDGALNHSTQPYNNANINNTANQNINPNNPNQGNVNIANTPYALNNPNGKQYYENPEYYNAVNNANAAVALRSTMPANNPNAHINNNVNTSPAMSQQNIHQQGLNNQNMNGMQSFINGSINPDNPTAGLMNASMNMSALQNVNTPNGMNNNGNGSQYDYNPQYNQNAYNAHDNYAQYYNGNGNGNAGAQYNPTVFKQNYMPDETGYLNNNANMNHNPNVNNGYMFPLTPHARDVKKARGRVKNRMILVLAAIMVCVLIGVVAENGVESLLPATVFTLMLFAAAWFLSVRFTKADYGDYTKVNNALEISIDQIKQLHPDIVSLFDFPVKVHLSGDDDDADYGPKSGHNVSHIWYCAPSDGNVHNYRLYAVLNKNKTDKIMNALVANTNKTIGVVLQIAPDGSANVIIDYNGGVYHDYNAQYDNNLRYMVQYYAVELIDTMYTEGASEYLARNDAVDISNQKKGMILPACILVFTVLWFAVITKMIPTVLSANVIIVEIIFNFILCIAFVISLVSLISRIRIYRQTKKDLEQQGLNNRYGNNQNMNNMNNNMRTDM